MTAVQRRALAAMDRLHLGAVATARGWVWRCDVRESEAAARDLLAAIHDRYHLAVSQAAAKEVHP